VSLLSHLLSVFVATNSPAVAVSNEFHDATGVAVPLADPNDPVEQDYQKLLADDDAAQAEVDQWIRNNQAFVSQGGVPNAELNRRIEERLKPVKQAYENFLAAHPAHARARVAYGSFLNDTQDEDGARAQWEQARDLDPKIPAVWNNLANFYGEHGPVTNAFACYEKAIELDPGQPVYFHNYGTTVYLFRRDAESYFHLTEPQVFDKALALYARAMQLAPDDFPLASDVAQTYYGIKPLRVEDALNAWTNALKVARDEVEREGVYLHLARIKLAAHRFDEVHDHLDAVTNAMYDGLKKRLARNLDIQENQALETNGVEILETNLPLAAPAIATASTNAAPPAPPGDQKP
jgi:tetratricopeptide (TPR) repeat protein